MAADQHWYQPLKKLPWHTPAVHFPVALLGLDTILEIWAWLQPQQHLGEIPVQVLAALFVWSGLVLAMPAIILGAVDWLRFDFSAEPVQRVLNAHLVWMGLSLGTYFLTALLPPGSMFRMVTALLAGLLLLLGSRRGASLVPEHGVTRTE